jgi:hypothetical protein
LYRRETEYVEQLEAESKHLQSLMVEYETLRTTCSKRFYKHGVEDFAKRLKEKYSQADILCPRTLVCLTGKELDELVKEMVGDTE